MVEKYVTCKDSEVIKILEVEQTLSTSNSKSNFDVLSNPEFYPKGQLYDLENPDRVLIERVFTLYALNNI